MEVGLEMLPKGANGGYILSHVRRVLLRRLPTPLELGTGLVQAPICIS